MSQLDRTAVIVVAHRWYYPLYRCIESLRNILANAEDLVFVDNGSSEMLCNWARERFPGITVLRLDENALFTGGYNRGLEHAIERDYEYALIVNADTQVYNQAFIGELQEVARRWPRAAFIGPLVYYRAPECIQRTSLFFPDILRYSLVWLPFRFFPRLVSRQHLTESEAEYLNGVCVLCRVSALKELGLMDEAFGAYMEDADWSWRAREIGWTSVFTPIPSIIHFEEKSGYEEHSLKTFMARRNTVLWFLKRGRRNSANAYAILSILLCIIRHLAHKSGETHHSFRQRFKTYAGLLHKEPIGAWWEWPDNCHANEIVHEKCHQKQSSHGNC